MYLPSIEGLLKDELADLRLEVKHETHPVVLACDRKHIAAIEAFLAAKHELAQMAEAIC
jgi:hypothetical protein